MLVTLDQTVRSKNLVQSSEFLYIAICSFFKVSQSARFTGKGQQGTLIQEGRDGKQWWLSRNVYSLIMWTRDLSSVE